MRLLKTRSWREEYLRVSEFLGRDFPPYAIVSHAWGDDEVQFADLRKTDVASKKGFRNIRFTLKQAWNDGLQYAWVDACCINKDSSAELSEAINAMFDWYANADVCYVYLDDVSFDGSIEYAKLVTQFRSCRWFKRGWTLQELLAPVNVRFYDSSWHYFGLRSSLSDDIQVATGRTPQYLLGPQTIRMASIAKRMSWAAHRVTTRPEDIAYCLMGIFEVNTPMLYGEGDRAFIRLQEEIMKSTDDQSLFAWKLTDRLGVHTLSGLLAPHPFAFATTGNVVPFASTDDRIEDLFSSLRQDETSHGRGTHAVTNRGLLVELHIEKAFYALYRNALYAMLHCGKEDEVGYVAILLEPTEESGGHFARVAASQLFTLEHPPRLRRSLYVRQLQTSISRASAPYHNVRYAETSGKSTQLGRVLPLPPISSRNKERRFLGAFIDRFGNQGSWQPASSQESGTITIPKGQGMLGAFMILQSPYSEEEYILLIGSDQSWQLAFDVWQPAARQEDLEILEEAKLVAKRPLQSLPQNLQNIFMPKPAGSGLGKLGSCNVLVETEEWPYHASYGLRHRDSISVFSVSELPKPGYELDRQHIASPTALVRARAFHSTPDRDSSERLQIYTPRSAYALE